MADTRYVTRDKWTSLTPTQVTYPNGRQVASGYDALYRRNGVNETSGGSSIARWQFFGRRTASMALGSGIICSFMNNAQTNSAVQVGVPNPAWGDKTTDRLGYDGSGRLIAKRFLPSGSTTSLVGFTTEYDPSRNKRYERALHAESRSTLYPGYDSMDRLREYQRGTLASGGGGVATPITLPGTDIVRDYNLDSLGNWKSTVYTPEGGSSTTEIRPHNKLNEITQFGSTPVTYDHGNNAANTNPLIAQRGNGNIVEDGTRVNAFDALDRLTTVSSTASGIPQVAAYTYDALGRRVLKIVTNGGVSGSIANATYRYLYRGQQIIEELLVGASTTTLRQFVWGHYIDELIQLLVLSTTTTPPLTAGTYYPVQDLLYRTTATTKSDGSIAEAYDFDAYGKTLMFEAAGTGGNWWADDAVTTLQPMCEFLFTGRQYDPDTEIYWYRARYYHPPLARFLERDPALYISDGNLYAFVAANPAIWLDPAGLFQGPDHERLTDRSFAQAFPNIPEMFRPCATTITSWLKHWNLQQDKGDNFKQNRRHFNRDVDHDVAGQPPFTLADVQARAATMTTEYKKYVASEMDRFDRNTTFPSTQKNCEEALRALGLLTHSWQDYFAHAIVVNGVAIQRDWLRRNVRQTLSSKTLWTAQPPVTGSPDDPGGTNGSIMPSSWSGMRDPGEHTFNEVAGAEGDARMTAAVNFVAEKYTRLLLRWKYQCICFCNKIGKPS